MFFSFLSSVRFIDECVSLQVLPSIYSDPSIEYDDEKISEKNAAKRFISCRFWILLRNSPFCGIREKINCRFIARQRGKNAAFFYHLANVWSVVRLRLWLHMFYTFTLSSRFRYIIYFFCTFCILSLGFYSPDIIESISIDKRINKMWKRMNSVRFLLSSSFHRLLFYAHLIFFNGKNTNATFIKLLVDLTKHFNCLHWLLFTVFGSIEIA